MDKGTDAGMTSREFGAFASAQHEQNTRKLAARSESRPLGSAARGTLWRRAEQIGCMIRSGRQLLVGFLPLRIRARDSSEDTSQFPACRTGRHDRTSVSRRRNKAITPACRAFDEGPIALAMARPLLTAQIISRCKPWRSTGFQ